MPHRCFVIEPRNDPNGEEQRTLFCYAKFQCGLRCEWKWQEHIFEASGHHCTFGPLRELRAGTRGHNPGGFLPVLPFGFFSFLLSSHCTIRSLCTLKLMTRICARMGSTDDLGTLLKANDSRRISKLSDHVFFAEHNISSFMKEMKETAYICKHASPTSLMLLDELGR